MSQLQRAAVFVAMLACSACIHAPQPAGGGAETPPCSSTANDSTMMEYIYQKGSDAAGNRASSLPLLHAGEHPRRVTSVHECARVIGAIDWYRHENDANAAPVGRNAQVTLTRFGPYLLANILYVIPGLVINGGDTTYVIEASTYRILSVLVGV